MSGLLQTVRNSHKKTLIVIIAWDIKVDCLDMMDLFVGDPNNIKGEIWQ